jgi:competence protein ComEC
MKDYSVVKFTILFIAGILLHSLITIGIFYIFILLAIIFSSHLFLKKYKNNVVILSFLTFVLLIIFGIFRTDLVQKTILLPANLYKVKNFAAYGSIDRIDLIKSYEVKFYLNVDSVKFRNVTYRNKIILIGRIRDEQKKLDSLYKAIAPGNVISINGTFTKGQEERNPGEFNYNKYLRTNGISGLLTAYSVSNLKIINHKINSFKSLVFSIRKSIDKSISELHNQQTASLLRGLLLADRSEIDYQTKANFINSGVIHVLAVSGLHTGFIILFLLILLGRFNLYLRSVLTIIGITAFMVITGMHPSVVRASVMALVIIIAFLTNRSTNLINSTFLAALIILLVKPFDLYKPGFQLSFSAVLSIGLIYPILNEKILKIKFITRYNFVKHFVQFCIISISAQLGTIPLTLTYFGKLSLIAIFANLIVIPAVGVIIAIAITALVFNLLLPQIAIVYGWANDFIVHYILKLINFSGRLSFSHLIITNFSLYDSLIFYILLIIILHSFKRAFSKMVFAMILALSVFNFYILSSIDNKHILKKGELNVLMIDVGQGDSFLVYFPDGKTALIDAGSVSKFYDNGERIIIPLLNYLGIDKIDYGFISHMDLDHYGGFLSLIHDKKIMKIYKPKIDSQDIVDIRFEKYLRENNVPYSYYDKKELSVGNAKIYILNKKDDRFYKNASKNNRSGTLKFEYGKESILFTGDMEKPEENHLENIYGEFLNSDVLKVAHHGSITSSSIKFINFVKPEISLVSVGIQNRYGHPSSTVVNRLKLTGSKVFRTDKLGAVCLRFNTDSVYVYNWRKYF